MTLARKLFFKLTALTFGLLLIAGAVLACLYTLQRLANTTQEEFEELRQIRRVEEQLSDALALVGQSQDAAAAAAVEDAMKRLEAFEEFQVSEHTELDERHAKLERDSAFAAFDALRRLPEQLIRVADGSEPADAEAVDPIETIHRARNALTPLAQEMEQAVARAQDRTSARFRITIASLGFLFAATVLAGVALNVRHYRSIINPLQYLREGTRRLTQGELAVRLEPRGDREFADLQTDFNRMAAELESFYRELEARVAEQSKRLAASERLASVGFLAAGVAHEINNPLSIMSGHAESLLRRLKDHPNGDCSSEEVRQSLDIIRDEAFRCKQITQGLLNLSRKRDEKLECVSVWRIVDDVVSLSEASAADRDVAISVIGDRSDTLSVIGSAPELKQVLLNLVGNAMDAAGTNACSIELHAGRANGCVELRVRDNGRGMSPETVARVFEPFFTLSKGRGGVGLGLAISLAIVEKHHGTLEAASAGPGCGSVFTLRLPAETEAAV